MSFQNITSSLARGTASAGTTSELEKIETEYLGKNGIYNREFSSLDKSQKSIQGKDFNIEKQTGIQIVNKKRQEINSEIGKIFFDVTIPWVLPPIGHLHLITQTIKEVTDIF